MAQIDKVDDHGLETLRKAAFIPDDAKKTEYAYRTKIIDAVEGSFAPSGLKTAIKISNLNVGDTPEPIPATALTGRNSISIQNKSPTEIVYIGNADVTAPDGWEVYPNDYFNLDITDTIVLYGVCSTGKSADLKIMELA